MNKPLVSPGAPEPALDLTGYTKVMVVKTDEVDGHVYRRGQAVTVDAATLKAMEEKGMVTRTPVPSAAAAVPGNAQS